MNPQQFKIDLCRVRRVDPAIDHSKRDNGKPIADVSRIAAEILLSLQPILTGANVDPPRMITLEPATLQMRVCGKPCNVMAWYAPEGTIYIDSRLDVVNHIGNRSVVVHELVHHVQRMSRGSAAES